MDLLDLLGLVYVQPASTAMLYNIPALIYGIVGFIVFLNLAAMSGAHAKYIYFEKTTNERVSLKKSPTGFRTRILTGRFLLDQKEVSQQTKRIREPFRAEELLLELRLRALWTAASKVGSSSHSKSALENAT